MFLEPAPLGITAKPNSEVSFKLSNSMKDGFLLIDKPVGITSHDVSHAISKKLQTKAGHTGTLDKFATGLLIICTGKATKQSGIFSSLPKEYEVTAFLGKETDTCDPEGNVILTTNKVPSVEEIENTVMNFTGKIQQIPPVFSAKKIKGVRASDLIRKGMEVKLKPVNVFIYSIEITDYSFPLLKMKVSCGAGTYIRALVRDIGRKLGCGGYVLNLRRTRIGNYSIEKATKFDDVIKLSPAELKNLIIPSLFL